MPDLDGYQRQLLLMRRSPYLDYPAHVHLETMAVCNAACSFCPYPTLPRQGTRMPDELIDKIIEDLTAIPRALPFQMSLFKVNEPFLDVRLFGILDTIARKLPQASVTLTTNASPITEDVLERVARVRQLGYLWISVNHHREAEYEQIMQLPFARTRKRLRMIHDRKAAGDLAARIVLSRVGDGSADDAAFRRWVAEEFPLFESCLFPRGDWLGQVGPTDSPIPAVGCQRWFELSITATGTVAHCCMDGRAEWPIGDVRDRHALAVYNAPEYRRLRETMLSRADAAPCSGCSFL